MNQNLLKAAKKQQTKIILQKLNLQFTLNLSNNFMQKPKSTTRLPNIKSKQDFQYSLLNNMEYYFENKVVLRNILPKNFYNVYSLIGKDDEDRKRFTSIFQEMQRTNDFDPIKLGLKEQQSRGIGSILGMAICDALGSCTQFQQYKKEGYGIINDGFADIQKAIKARKLRSRHGENDTWTDDASMGIAMAFSLILKKYKFDPIHIRYMFMLWICHGLGNGGRRYSIGLGGNIKISMDEFQNNQASFAFDGQYVKNFNNGNGSLMRLAPIPVAFHDNKQDAMQFSALQSKTTHNGFEASECCRLLAAIIVEMINRKQNEKMEIEGQQQWKVIFDKVCQQFESKEKSVQFLAKSEMETKEIYNHNIKKYKSFKHFNPQMEDRNWNWKQKDFTYSKFRNKQMPGYIGSYCMDGFAMALHTVWHTSSFKQCALMNANMGGDCDTVGSIAGQMAGAIYGIDKEMLKLYSEMKDFKEKRFEVFLLGYKLINKKNQSVVRQMQLTQEEINKKRQKSEQRREQQNGRDDSINKKIKQNMKYERNE